ncbi:hypothetical protein BD289DRAFT_191008 [Coniella lustricola]|uniref:Uncharacterized protein n=1 Tax=Coniella lustricola TaxID=2025994 RepID=A0A2T2ZSW3_9PEZI|nr:hypothetical protein BD289DRAFT_191008 [Coniella lustricola]
MAWYAFIIFALCAVGVFGQVAETLPTFGDIVGVLGNMERTDQDFQDGLALDLFSPKNRTLTVAQNPAPLAGHFVTGSSGEAFVALMNYSYIIEMNETAEDLIAKIEIPYTLDMLQKAGVQEGNTYVGTLAADKMSWVVKENTRNVHRSEQNTRIIKMTSLDGEYMLLGRTSIDQSNIFVQYGQGATRTVNITAGGRQEAEFIDGLRFSMVAQTSLTMNVDLKNGISPADLMLGAQSLYTFAWIVNTSDANAVMQTALRVPVNGKMLDDLKPAGQPNAPQPKLTLARRPLNASSTTMFEAVDTVIQTDSHLVAENITQIDGQYIVLVERI